MPTHNSKKQGKINYSKTKGDTLWKLLDKSSFTEIYIVLQKYNSDELVCLYEKHEESQSETKQGKATSATCIWALFWVAIQPS